MADAGLFIGWGEVVRGREAEAVETFNATVEYFAGLQAEGAIESFEPVFLELHGGDLNGFFLVRGEAAQLAALRVDEEFEGRHPARGAHRRQDGRRRCRHGRAARASDGDLHGGDRAVRLTDDGLRARRARSRRPPRSRLRVGRRLRSRGRRVRSRVVRARRTGELDLSADLARRILRRVDVHVRPTGPDLRELSVRDPCRTRCPFVHGPHSATSTAPAFPALPTWMCAAIARHSACENVRRHESFALSFESSTTVPVNAPVAPTGTPGRLRNLEASLEIGRSACTSPSAGAASREPGEREPRANTRCLRRS